jgi:fumarate reductase flavoprotein subunit
VAGEEAARFAREAPAVDPVPLRQQEEDGAERARRALSRPAGGEKLALIRDAMAASMEKGCGIYRLEGEMQDTCRTLAGLVERIRHVGLADHAPAWNTEWLATLELGYQLDVARAMAHAALARRESRGAHQRLDPGLTHRDDAAFLKHSLAHHSHTGPPRIDWSAVTITTSPPGERVYGHD